MGGAGLTSRSMNELVGPWGEIVEDCRFVKLMSFNFEIQHSRNYLA